MTEKITHKNIILQPQDNDRLANLCGTLDENLRQIESHMHVQISNRGNNFIIKGNEKNVPRTSELIERLYTISASEELTPKQLHMYMTDTSENKSVELDEKSRSVLLKIIANNFLDKMNESERLFALLPLIHSESISDHEKGYELMEKYLKNHSDLEKIKKFWLEHTGVIKRFGRYPHRNKVLNRVSSDDEIEFLNSPNSSW